MGGPLDRAFQNFYAGIDDGGYASDVDSRGDAWDFRFDMDSAAVDDAIQDWADANGVTID